MRTKPEGMSAGLRGKECRFSGLRTPNQRRGVGKESVAILMLRRKAFTQARIASGLFILGLVIVQLSLASNQFGASAQQGETAAKRIGEQPTPWCDCGKGSRVGEVLGVESPRVPLQQMSTIIAVAAIATEERELHQFQPVSSWRPVAPLTEGPCFQHLVLSFSPWAVRGRMPASTLISQSCSQRYRRRTKKAPTLSQLRHLQRARGRKAQWCRPQRQRATQRRSCSKPLLNCKSRSCRPPRRIPWRASLRGKAGAESLKKSLKIKSRKRYLANTALPQVWYGFGVVVGFGSLLIICVCIFSDSVHVQVVCSLGSNSGKVGYMSFCWMPLRGLFGYYLGTALCYMFWYSLEVLPLRGRILSHVKQPRKPQSALGSMFF